MVSLSLSIEDTLRLPGTIGKRRRAVTLGAVRNDEAVEARRGHWEVTMDRLEAMLAG